MDQMIKKVQALKQKLMVLTPMVNNFILILKNVLIVELVNLNVLLKLFLKRVKFLKNGVNIVRSIMIGLVVIIQDNKK